ncbi:hypothetical protein SLA2020_137030 [Shorea laevis]
MASSACNIPSCSYRAYPIFSKTRTPRYIQSWGNLLFRKPGKISFCAFSNEPELAITSVKEMEEPETGEPKRRFRWVEIGPNITEEQKEAISKLPHKMKKRCKAVMKQIICFSQDKGSLEDLLAVWVRIMKPRRADWLAVLKQLKIMEHPLYLQVAEAALLEESFEANVRDYTKIIHTYGEQNQLQDAESTLITMTRRGFICDQVTLTIMIHLYSRAGNPKLAEETFEEIKLLGEPLDKKSHGAMILAYIRAGMPEKGEHLLLEMDSLEVYAGREVYKALLRAYSIIGNTKGAQRVFDAIQLAGFSPDARVCGLLINAYAVAGQSEHAHVAFENMRRAGLEPSDKCIALVLAAYEKENEINKALDFLMGLERHGVMVGKEASGILAAWFKRLGVVEEVELLLREYALSESHSEVAVS